MTRRNQILIGILVLQILAVALVFWPRSTASSSGQSLFPDATADKIVKLTVIDAEGTSIQVAKVDGNWVLPEADNYPCKADKVPALLTQIAGLTTDRLVTQTSGSHKRLKVAGNDFERRIEIELDGGAKHLLYLGSAPSYGTTHVRADDQDEVYLASDLSTYDLGTQATTWVEPVYLSISKDQMTAVTLENAQGRLELIKVGEAWMLKDQATDETVDQTKVESLLSRLASVSLVRPLGKSEKPEYGLQQPSAAATIETKSDSGNKTFTLEVGAQDAGDKSYVVISSESPYYVRVSEYTVKDLVEKTRDGLLQLPPTPTPTP